MASTSFTHPGQLPQPTLPLDPFFMTNDQIKDKVVETHLLGDENYDVESLLNVAENIIKHSTQTADTYLLKDSTEPTDHAEDKPFSDSSLPLSKINQIASQMTSQPARDEDHAHQTTMAILYELERSNWGAKVAISLAAFALEYGNFWHEAANQVRTDPPGNSLARLNRDLRKIRFQGIETEKSDLTELNNLVKVVLPVIEKFIELEKLSTVGYDQREVPELLNAIQDIPVDVYWIIITIAVCATRIAFRLGDSQHELKLSKFDRKLHSIRTNLTEKVTSIRKKIGDSASRNINEPSTGPNIINPNINFGRKETFYAGKIGIDLTDVGVAPVPSTWIVPAEEIPPVNRRCFPDDFIFGTATSAYQIEGKVNERGESAWDYFTHNYPDKIKDKSNGDVACDAFSHLEEDIKLMKEMNTKAYRFSISWSRILPAGMKGGKNQNGIDRYNRLLDLLKENDLTPFVTLFHVDRPQALEEKFGGFLDKSMAEEFKYFARVCFDTFGDRVKHWITLNEPYVYCYLGYVQGKFPPCGSEGLSKDPYKVAHNLLLAHAGAVDVYKEKYQTTQNGEIGITLNSPWTIAHSEENELDQQAAERALDFILGWFLDPIIKGDYPKRMRDRVGKRLPEFTQKESDLLHGSFDFIGLNYYTAFYVLHHEGYSCEGPNYEKDKRFRLETKRGKELIGKPTASGLHVYPKGLRKLLSHLHEECILHIDKECNRKGDKKCKNPSIYITENGIAPFESSLSDIDRVHFHNDHLHHLHLAIKEDKVNVKGYFVWSLLDNFEWTLGNTVRFGITHVDFKDKEERPRIPKLSAKWFEIFLKN